MRKRLIKLVVNWKKEKKDKSIFLKSFSEKFYSNILDDNNFIISGLKLKMNLLQLAWAL